MRDTPIPEQRCWKCGYKMDETTEAFGDATPSEGDASMCLACGAIAVFNKDLTLRKPTPDEQLRLELLPEMIQAQIVRDHMVGDKIKEREHLK